ncbi:MAG TPA: transglutaminase-like domain-containing protein [Burkholderiales bacterium]|nr:transglutaminase-like domain-containing protein [Burkholderiales bacterium]
MRRPWFDFRWLWLLATLLLLPGCASRYFRAAGPPPAEPVRHALADLRWHEYWTGITFNGDKIGFTHTVIGPMPDQPGRYRIHSEASLLIRLVGFRKRIQLHADDVVNGDLSLVRFDYDYTIDGNALQISGTQDTGSLRAIIHNAGRASEQVLQAKSAIYPASVIDLYPVVNGLKVGAQYRFQAYSGETQSLLDVQQSVEGYESSDLFLGNAFKVRTAAAGNNTTTWIDESGKPLLELTLEGVMMSALEGESEAKRYLALAALNKRDTLIDFSLVKPDRPIPDPRHTTRLKIAVTGTPNPPLASATQRCEPADSGWVCDIARGPEPSSLTALQTESYLKPSVTVPSDAPAIRDLARNIAGGASTPKEQVARLLSWIQTNIKRAPVDSFSALDVLQAKQAECQGHAYLYTAFARSLGIPTRVVNGLVYSEQFGGFLYHSWTQSFIDGGWQAVDPIFGQTEADATHIEVVEGESAADVLPLIEWVGKARIRVLAVEPDASAARH